MKREYPEYPIVAVAAVAFNPENRLLLVRRAKDPGRGSWGIPGGVVELGEHLENALKRELIEETGVAVEPLEVITVVERVYRDACRKVQYHYVIVEYLCRAPDTAPAASDDVDRAVWASLEEARAFPLPAITRKVVEKGWNRFIEKQGTK